MRKFALILAAVLLLTSAAGCNKTPSTGTGVGTPITTTAAAPLDIDTTENVWLLEPEYTALFIGQELSTNVGMFEGKLGVYVTDDKGDTKCGYVSENGGFAIEPAYGQVQRFSNGYAAAVFHSGSANFGVIDETSGFVSPREFASIGNFAENGLAPAKLTGTDKFGYINTKGEFAIMPLYDMASDFVDGYALTTVFDKNMSATYGFVDEAGELLGKQNYILAQSFSEGYAAVWIGKDFASAKAGFIDTDGKMAIDAQFRAVGSFKDGLAPAVPADGELYGFIDTTGAFVIEPQFVYTPGFSDGLAMVAVRNADGSITEGYIDTTGAFVIEPIYYSCQSFRDGYASVSTKELYESGTGIKIIIDRNGNRIVNEDLLLPDGTSIASTCYGNIVIAAKDGKYGILRLADVE